MKLLGAGRRDEADVPNADPEPEGVPVTSRRTTRGKPA